MSKTKVGLAIAATVLLLLIGGFLWIRAAGARKFEKMDRHVRALHEDVKKRDTARPPRPGAAVAGNAWDDYTKALDAVERDKDALKAVDLFVSRDAKADLAKARELVTAHAPTLALLQKGARRELSDANYAWSSGADMKMPGLFASQKLAHLAAARARLLAEEGKPREAAELLLDGCQFARDLGTNSPLITTMISMAVYGIQLEELRDLLLSDKLSKEDVLEIDRGLETVDRTFPRIGWALVNESLFMGYTIARSPGLDWSAVGDPGSVFGFWRYGFSARIALASAFDENSALLKRAEGIDDVSWTESQRILAGIDKDSAASKNPFVRMTAPGLTKTSSVGRERKAQVRLLRALCTWKSKGELPELDDPFGAKLLHSEKDGVIRVWSLWQNGVDDGGVGAWKPAIDKDLVLEWKR